VLERLAQTNAEKLRIVKVNAEENRDWAMKQRIRGVPTMQFYYGGMKLHEFSGAYPEDVIQKKIDHFAVSGSAQKIDENGNPVEPAIRPMPKDWLPPGVSPQ